WKAARGAIPAELQEVIDRTGKEIAHLTTGRRPAGDPKKGWAFEFVFRMFFGPLHLFLKHAEPSRLDAGVPFFIRALPTPPTSTTEAVAAGTSLSLEDESTERTDVSMP